MKPFVNNDEDRFEFVRNVILTHKHKKNRTILATALSNMHVIGINPKSILTCSYPALSKKGIAGVRKIIGGNTEWISLNNWSSEDEDKIEWNMDMCHIDDVNGLLCNHSLDFYPSIRCNESITNRRFIGNNISIGGSCLIAWHNNIEYIGDDLQIYGNLNLHYLPNLTHIGKHICVNGDLKIYKCEKLKLDEIDFHVGGKIDIDPCEQETLYRIRTRCHKKKIEIPMSLYRLKYNE